MERKIGEIFEYQGEWYQCLEKHYCNECVFRDAKCNDVRKILGNCSVRHRSDKKSVIFKKLEKVGEPYEYFVQHRGIVMLQPYKLFATPFINGVVCNVNYDTNTIDLEIKQNKEDMEEKNNAKHSNSEKIGKNLKEFDLEAAKSGKPVCTRDGRKARIICFDAKCNLPIIALITDAGGDESLARYNSNGRFTNLNESDCDLMMLPEKKEGWVNVYKDSVYDTKDDALIGRSEIRGYIDTIKINWSE